ncbi:MAG: hypothetical protein NTU44_04330 [Bacteroidetes bacterium]|nr:hypothetical protein [Bacteroidota bacterium]
MLNINKKIVLDEKKKPVAVQVSIKTFEKMEQLLEDYALAQLIEENDDSNRLTLEEAKEIYHLRKK